MLNRFVKKSVASKLFLMNLLILICIIVSQLVFQVIYFEEYYLNQKKNKLEKSLEEFKYFLSYEYSKDKIMDFIQDIKKKENVALSFKNLDFSGRIGLEAYMGNRHILINDDNSNRSYKIILGEQFPKVDIKKGDVIQAIGSVDEYGYLFPQRIFINGTELQSYYNITPSDLLQSESSAMVSPALVIPSGENIYIGGKAEWLVQEDNTYTLLANSDLYLSIEDKRNITLNNKYIVKSSNINSIDEVLVYSERFGEGYIIAITPLSEVNDVIGTMNSYYFIVFIVAFFIVIIISLVYSRYMTKPLVEMSNIAKKISECDFQYKYYVKSEDEIGVLGNSLNLISNNLEKSLSELQETNEKLKKEMNIKNIQEEKRKELIANISHELKTPITIIQGSINGVKSGVYTEDMYEDILEETNKMNELVKEMLEISKLESLTFALKKEAFDLTSVFLKEKDKLKSIIKEKNLNIVFNDYDEAIAFGDEKRINQVVTNLLTNAIKYTPDCEKIDVTIKLNQDEDRYVFTIENFGITLTEEEIEKIWDPFYRKEKSRNKKFGGTGLGLSIVKRILEIHNSEFGVESTSNSVRFYFTIQKCMVYYSNALDFYI